MHEVIKDLVINEATLSQDVMGVAAQMMYWGRQATRAERVSEVRERDYRIWRARICLGGLDAPADDPKWKKPTKDQLEWLYRTHPDYTQYRVNAEQAVEAANTCEAIHQAFKSKQFVLDKALNRARTDSQSQLVI